MTRTEFYKKMAAYQDAVERWVADRSSDKLWNEKHALECAICAEFERLYRLSGETDKPEGVPR